MIREKNRVSLFESRKKFQQGNNAIHLLPQEIETEVSKIPTTQRHWEEISPSGGTANLTCNFLGNFIGYVDIDVPHDGWRFRLGGVWSPVLGIQLLLVTWFIIWNPRVPHQSQTGRAKFWAPPMFFFFSGGQSPNNSNSWNSRRCDFLWDHQQPTPAIRFPSHLSTVLQPSSDLLFAWNPWPALLHPSLRSHVVWVL